ncbi:MAG: protein TolA [Candidatus Schekmanbacteria bacterium RBG_16_38_10]|uniref:Protein TolA n=1 Tax=Candidatus Schekmanbacteria bacterium RBG_16_38_10 TaxID=1817879 RepID=A0A1F7RXD0_9BACT|nr:MAG: protein TolA [Candidatus Schekmanbacteria bacterium RBG_16_38_10]
MLILSLLAHMVFVSVLIYIPDFRRIEISGSQVISVDIVSLPRHEPVSGSSGNLVQQIKPSKPSIKKEVKAEESHSVKKMAFRKEDKKEKKIEKKKAEEKQKIKNKITDASDYDTKSDEAIEKAIEKIKLGLITKKGEEKVVAGSGAGGSGIGYSSSGQGGSGKTADLKFQIYYSIIWSKIKDAWVLPENTTSVDKKLEAIIAIRIKKDGEIVKVWTEKSSGNNYFDQSALRAIAKANPLPPVPEGYGEEYFELGIRFLPSEQ